MRGRGKREEARGSFGGGRALLAYSLFLLSFSLTACAKHKDVSAKKDDKKQDLPVKSAAFGAGYTTVYQTADPKSLPSFDLKWSQGGFDAKTGTVDYGHLVEPRGQIFQDAKPTSTYRSDTGNAVRETKRLNMDGHVVLQTIDRKQTLRAPHGEYRGDAKLVRATGGVTATGTFGTLSGVPELWATPDLRLIGTPDMFAKTLKLPALATLAATAALGSAKLQNADQYTVSGNSGYLIDTRTPGKTLVTLPPAKGQRIVVTLPARGLVFRFSVKVVLELDPKKQNEVRHMTSAGPVDVVQTTPTGTNTIDGTSAEYDAKAGAATADLQVGGRATLTSVEKGAKGSTTTVSKGDRGSAVLRTKPTGDENGLQSATLTGNVTVDSKGDADGTFAGTGDRMVYTPGAATNGVDLTGHVVLTRVSKDKDGTTNTVVSRGEKAHAILDPSPAAGASPMKNATLDGGVAIDVSGSNKQTFKGTGDRVVYTGAGQGGTAVMTGALKFSGDLPTFLGKMSKVDTATVTIGKSGMETVEATNSDGSPTTTIIDPKADPNAPKKPPTVKGKKPEVKKGRKGP